jgi:hypothetical protein
VGYLVGYHRRNDVCRGVEMSKAQQVFEAIMATKGHNDFAMSATGKYLVASLQMRWTYFQLGWEMREVMS